MSSHRHQFFGKFLNKNATDNTGVDACYYTAGKVKIFNLYKTRAPQRWQSTLSPSGDSAMWCWPHPLLGN